MHSLLVDKLADIRELSTSIVDVGYDRSLHVAAATVAEARPTAINATRVVGVLGAGTPSAFEAHVSQLAAEYELDARVRVSGGMFSVRFSRPTYTL